MNRKKWLIVALFLPIAVLLAIAIKNQVTVSWGKEFILPVEGFDPRDILSGHYLQYRVVYAPTPIETQCLRPSSTAYICLEPTNFLSFEIPAKDGCKTFIKGSCDRGRFFAGIERFYIPEGYSRNLDSAIRAKQGKIVVSVSRNGESKVKDFLVNDCPWKKFVAGSCIK